MSEGADNFFHENAAPSNYKSVEECLFKFCSKFESTSTKIVLVTSGGTTVPLEKNTVRFIDNFSAGTRGSSSTEYFLKEGYCVIFLYRDKSLRPFVRHFAKIHPLDLFDSDPELVVSEKFNALVKAQKQQFESSKDRLLEIPFETLFEYLFYLKLISQHLGAKFGSRAMFYLAAAVSDFYIPQNELSEHKIQSSQGIPNLKLASVPKMLSLLSKNWAPQAFRVGFKLETSPALLVEKAQVSLIGYNLNIVIGNLLNDRKKKVILFTKEGDYAIQMNQQELDQGSEIEEKIIKDLIIKHSIYIQN